IKNFSIAGNQAGCEIETERCRNAPDDLSRRLDFHKGPERDFIEDDLCPLVGEGLTIFLIAQCRAKPSFSRMVCAWAKSLTSISYSPSTLKSRSCCAGGSLYVIRLRRSRRKRSKQPRRVSCSSGVSKSQLSSYVRGVLSVAPRARRRWRMADRSSM